MYLNELILVNITMIRRFHKRENIVKIKEKILRYLKEGTCKVCFFKNCNECSITILMKEWQK